MQVVFLCNDMPMYKIDEWRQKIIDKDGIKSYKHIDRKINIIKSDADFNFVKSVLENLSQHQFLPFIKRTEISSRYKRGKCSCGNLQKKLACTESCSYRQKKKSSKNRPIMYASHLDSMIYSYYNYILSESYERKLANTPLDESVIAYRKVPIGGESEKNKSNIHFAKESFDYIAEKRNCAVITADISGFFDNLDHKHLLESIKKISDRTSLSRLYKVFRSVTKYRYIDYYSSFRTPEFKKLLSESRYKPYLKFKEHIRKNKSNKGIPQGSPISGLFSNIYMYDFDSKIVLKYPNIFYRRYSDDILIVCDETEVTEIKKFLFDLILENRLEIQNEKTNVATFKGGVCVAVVDGDGSLMRRKYVDYLGFEFSGSQVFVRKKSFSKLKHKQERKVKKRVHNTTYVHKDKTLGKSRVRKSNYLKMSQKIFSSEEIIKQVKTLSRNRNKKRKLAALNKKEKEKS